MLAGLAVTLFGVWFTASGSAASKDFQLSRQQIG